MVMPMLAFLRQCVKKARIVVVGRIHLALTRRKVRVASLALENSHYR